MNTPSLEEQLAIARLKQGDLDGMEPLVRRYQAQAVYAAYLVVRDLQQAEDIVQTAFLNAAAKIQQFNPERSFGPWFLRSVIHAAIKAAERQKRLVSLDGEEEELAGWADRLLAPDPSPGEIAETNETIEMVWKALAQLTPQQRGVVVMRHFLEMDDAEMVRELGRPRTTVRWWLRTARKRLQEILLPFWRTSHPEPSKGKQEDAYE